VCACFSCIHIMPQIETAIAVNVQHSLIADWDCGLSSTNASSTIAGARLQADCEVQALMKQTAGAWTTHCRMLPPPALFWQGRTHHTTHTQQICRHKALHVFQTTASGRVNETAQGQATL